jgi:hypothetical protein
MEAIQRSQAKISQKLQAPFKPPSLPKAKTLRAPTIPEEDLDHKGHPQQDVKKKD